MLSTLLLVLALTDSPEIHRCRNADGSLSFQDRPCAVGAAPPRAGAAGRPPPDQKTPRNTRTDAADERLLAGCSERFLRCASDDDAVMDRCIASIRRCGDGRGGACCPQACIERYGDLRRSGEPRARAVRLALLDPERQSCTTASR